MTAIRAELALGALLVDGAAFALAVERVGIGGEAHPIAVAVFAAGGIQAILAAKVAQAIAAALVTHRLRATRWSYLPAIVGMFGAVTALAAVLA